MKNCKACQAVFIVNDADRKFYDKISPVIQGKKFMIPEPTLCPVCRQQRRLMHANMQTLYRRKCDATGQMMISIYSADQPFPVYHNQFYGSDAFDPLRYGQEFDFNRSFFEQFGELSRRVPRAALATVWDSLQNSQYLNYASFVKNCYLVFHTSTCEDSYYCVGVKRSKNIVDCRNVFNSEICYECIDCRECYDLKFSQDCKGCNSSWFLRDCTGCKNCFGCVNLANKQYVIFNESKTKTEYEQFMRDFNSGDYSQLEAMKNRVDLFWIEHPLRAIHGAQNEEVSGDHLYQCNNVHDSFHVDTARDCRFCDRMYNNCQDCYDFDQYGEKAQMIYEAEDSGMDIYHILFSLKARNGSQNIYYSDAALTSKNCFGSISLKHNSYCILNRQYSQEEYERLLPKIIEHMQRTKEWGEFFPATLSPFAYNETIAQEYYPLTKQEVLQKGWRWKDHADEMPKVERVIPAEKLPDAITAIPNDVLNWAIECQKTKRPFRLTGPELQFYRNHQLPIPRLHPDERFSARAERGSGHRLYDRTCAKCQTPIQTTTSPKRPEPIYCEACYLKEVY